MEPKLAQHMTHHLAMAVQPMIASAAASGALFDTNPPWFAAVFLREFPEIAFIAYEELPPKVGIQSTSAIPGMP